MFLFVDLFVLLLFVCVTLYVTFLRAREQVGDARRKCNVQYPNLYATPGVHKQANEFNRWQRGHQSIFETLTMFSLCGLIGGLKYPIFTAVSGALCSLGNYLFQFGYGEERRRPQVGRFLARFGNVHFRGWYNERLVVK